MTILAGYDLHLSILKKFLLHDKLQRLLVYALLDLDVGNVVVVVVVVVLVAVGVVLIAVVVCVTSGVILDFRLVLS